MFDFPDIPTSVLICVDRARDAGVLQAHSPNPFLNDPTNQNFTKTFASLLDLNDLTTVTAQTDAANAIQRSEQPTSSPPSRIPQPSKSQISTSTGPTWSPDSNPFESSTRTAFHPFGYRPSHTYPDYETPPTAGPSNSTNTVTEHGPSAPTPSRAMDNSAGRSGSGSWDDPSIPAPAPAPAQECESSSTVDQTYQHPCMNTPIFTATEVRAVLDRYGGSLDNYGGVDMLIRMMIETKLELGES